MAWILTEIVVSGEAVNGGINSRDDSVVIEIPFNADVSVGDKVKALGNEYEIITASDVGGREETMLLEVKNGKSVSRRASSKAGR